MKISIPKEKVFHFLLLILFFIIFEIRYFTFVYENYQHAKFDFGFSLNKYIIGKFLFIISLYLTNKTKSKFIYITMMLFNLLIVIPNLIMYQFNNSPLTISVLIIIFMFFLSINLLKIPSIKFFEIKKQQILPLLFATIIILFIPFFYKYGFNFDLRVFSLGEVMYEIRKASSQISSPLTTYLYFPLKNFLIPILLVYAILKNKKWLIVSGILMVIYLFLIIPHKSTFFSIFVIIAFYFHDDYYKKLNFIFLGILGILVLSITSSILFNYGMPESIFLRRMFFIPAQLNIAYFEIFNDQPIYLSHSILSSIFNYPFSLDPSHYVADVYFKRPEMMANNGIISDGFMNFGVIGSLVFSFFISIIFHFFDKLEISPKFYGIIFLIIKLTMGAAFFTMLLTHGLILFIIISIIFLRKSAFQHD